MQWFAGSTSTDSSHIAQDGYKPEGNHVRLIQNRKIADSRGVELMILKLLLLRFFLWVIS